MEGCRDLAPEKQHSNVGGKTLAGLDELLGSSMPRQRPVW